MGYCKHVNSSVKLKVEREKGHLVHYTSINSAAIKKWHKTHAPERLVPDNWMRLDRWYLTINGKAVRGPFQTKIEAIAHQVGPHANTTLLNMGKISVYPKSCLRKITRIP